MRATKLNQKLVGLNGLEPSTSRLSGGRSNLLSYKPIFLIRLYFVLSFSSYPRQAVSTTLPRILPLAVLQGALRSLCLGPCPVSLGGDNRDRTDDPLLAKQVLSQLSYTPVAICFKGPVAPHNTPLIRKKCPLLRKHHICFANNELFPTQRLFFRAALFGCLCYEPQKLNNEKT